jgi:hypothetical protein
MLNVKYLLVHGFLLNGYNQKIIDYNDTQIYLGFLFNIYTKNNKRR